MNITNKNCHQQAVFAKNGRTIVNFSFSNMAALVPAED